jgi:hypothetical protein
MNTYVSLQNLVDNYNLQDFEKKNVMNIITELVRIDTEDPRGETEFRNLVVELRKTLKAATIALEVLRDYDRRSSSNLLTGNELTDIEDPRGETEFRNLVVELRKTLKATTIALEVLKMITS